MEVNAPFILTSGKKMLYLLLCSRVFPLMNYSLSTRRYPGSHKPQSHRLDVVVSTDGCGSSVSGQGKGKDEESPITPNPENREHTLHFTTFLLVNKKLRNRRGYSFFFSYV